MGATATPADYLERLPAVARRVVEQVNMIVKRTVPDAVPGTSYGILDWRVDGRPFLSVAGWKAHVSIYPVPAGDADLVARLAPYRRGRGTLGFPLSAPLPVELIADVARALHAERRQPR